MSGFAALLTASIAQAQGGHAPAPHGTVFAWYTILAAAFVVVVLFLMFSARGGARRGEQRSGAGRSR